MVDVYLGGEMGLNIKNGRVCELARLASERTGLSQTAVIGEALTAYLAALPDERVERLARIRDLLAEFDAITTPADIEAMRETAAHLYDDQYPTG